ncbi:hypothetical protein CH253_08150 [Rhodococcus sp. 06-156-3C]|uniref:hypothetical protein n=1 Tax=Rhodococcus sp. 06-156-3C TaxID=2022486 RepID=UPI000B9C073A|nr:hypothetical protein [Rhodococcus sp. 06-156-3C]OZD23824.1 hypothetical protein CH253_08150 [Rhodococcus sp. 06-156-3C]
MSERYQDTDPLEPADDDGTRFFTSVAIGSGRYADLEGVGTLWTDDADALQLGFATGADNDAANELRRLLVAYATEGWTATEAFESVLTDYPNATVKPGPPP